MKNICAECGDEFEAPVIRRKYCSIKCKGRYLYKKNHGRHNYLIVCKGCKKEFKPFRRNQSFCSRDCGVKGRSGPLRRQKEKYNTQCAECGKPLYKRKSYLEQTKVVCCSIVCRSNNIRKRYKGKNNPNYRNIPLKRCEGCGRPFRSYNKTRRYCTHSCSHSLAASEAIANAHKGYQAEIWCRDELQKQGYHSTLSARSRGEYDVIAISDREILLVQVKRTKANTASRIFPKAALRQLSAAITPNSEIIRKQMWTWQDDTGWHIKEV